MGFDTAIFVEQPVSDEFLCTICHLALEKPMSVCKEGHTFCAACIAQWGRRSDQCPDCRSTMLSEPVPNRLIQNLILRQEVNCPEKSKDTPAHKRPREETPNSTDDSDNNSLQGDTGQPTNRIERCCDWKGALSDYIEKHHTGECRLREVRCECGNRIRLFELKAHKVSACGYRTVTCELCQGRMKKHYMTRHMKRICPEVSVTCEFCLEVMLRKQLGRKPDDVETDDPFIEVESERENEDNDEEESPRRYSRHYKVCPKLKVLCEFHHLGCNELIKRENLANHHSDFARRHAGILSNEIQNIRDDNKWMDQRLTWRISVWRLMEASNSAALGDEYETLSQRILIGPYSSLLRLKVNEEGDVIVSVCVENSETCPLIDRLIIRTTHGQGILAIYEEESMHRHVAEGGYFIHGGSLRVSDTDDDIDDSHDLPKATIHNLVTWQINGTCVFDASFRLKRPETVDLYCDDF